MPLESLIPTPVGQWLLPEKQLEQVQLVTFAADGTEVPVPLSPGQKDALLRDLDLVAEGRKSPAQTIRFELRIAIDVGTDEQRPRTVGSRLADIAQAAAIGLAQERTPVGARPMIVTVSDVTESKDGAAVTVTMTDGTLLELTAREATG